MIITRIVDPPNVPSGDIYDVYAEAQNEKLQQIPDYGFDMGTSNLRELSDSSIATIEGTGGGFDSSKGFYVGGTLPKLWVSSLSVNKNLFLNTATLSTQNVTLLTGDYTFGFTSGGGSITSSDGTGTATGHGAVSAGGSRTITVTVAGTFTFTVAGTVEEAMLNAGSTILNYQHRTNTAVQPVNFGETDSSVTFLNGSNLTSIIKTATRTSFSLSSSGPRIINTTYNPSLSGTDPVTVMGWVNFNGLGSSEYIVNKGTEIVLRKGVGDNPEFILNGFTSDDRATGSGTLSASTWYFLAGSFDGTTIRVLRNGVVTGSATPTGSYSSVVQNFAIGGVDAPNAKIDGVRVFESYLPESAILEIFNAEKSYYGI